MILLTHLSQKHTDQFDIIKDKHDLDNIQPSQSNWKNDKQIKAVSHAGKVWAASEQNDTRNVSTQVCSFGVNRDIQIKFLWNYWNQSWVFLDMQSWTFRGIPGFSKQLQKEHKLC